MSDTLSDSTLSPPVTQRELEIGRLVRNGALELMEKENEKLRDRLAAQETMVHFLETSLNKLRTQFEQFAARPAASVGRPPWSIKINPPETFKGDSFLQSVSLCMKCNPGDYADEATKITFTLSYMTEGRAAQFRNEALEFVSLHSERYQWATYKDFKAAFRLEFTPLDAKGDALTVLHSKEYYQRRSESLDDYIDRL